MRTLIFEGGMASTRGHADRCPGSLGMGLPQVLGRFITCLCRAARLIGSFDLFQFVRLFLDFTGVLARCAAASPATYRASLMKRNSFSKLPEASA